MRRYLSRLKEISLTQTRIYERKKFASLSFRKFPCHASCGARREFRWPTNEIFSLIHGSGFFFSRASPFSLHPLLQFFSSPVPCSSVPGGRAGPGAARQPSTMTSPWGWGLALAVALAALVAGEYSPVRNFDSQSIAHPLGQIAAHRPRPGPARDHPRLVFCARLAWAGTATWQRGPGPAPPTPLQFA